MKVALITGANSGIGLATVKTFLQNQYFVIAHYHSSNQNLKTLAGPQLHMIQADFRRYDEVEKLARESLAVKGHIDVLVNNAAAMVAAPSLEASTEAMFDEMIQVNLKAPCMLSKLLIGQMIERAWGRIINVSSVGVKFGGSEATAFYSMAKAGLEAFSATLSKIGAKHGVLCNVIRPGVIDTDLHKKTPGKNMDARAKLIPMGRMGEPKEVASAIFFLASEGASYMSGNIIGVTGGE